VECTNVWYEIHNWIWRLLSSTAVTALSTTWPRLCASIPSLGVFRRDMHQVGVCYPYCTPNDMSSAAAACVRNFLLSPLHPYLMSCLSCEVLRG